MKNMARIHYSRDFKKKVLYKMLLNVPICEIFKESGYDEKIIKTKDKYYFSKLIFRWKKDFEKCNKEIFFMSAKITNRGLLDEIKLLSDE